MQTRKLAKSEPLNLPTGLTFVFTQQPGQGGAGTWPKALDLSQLVSYAGISQHPWISQSPQETKGAPPAKGDVVLGSLKQTHAYPV